MNAITLWPEWLRAFTHLGKSVENRTWKPPDRLIGQRLALHAGASIGGGRGLVGLMALSDCAAAAGYSVSFVRRKGGEGRLLVPVGDEVHRLEIQRSCIVAHGRLRCATHVDRPGLLDSQLHGRGWAFGPWCWWLDDLQVLDTPIPAKGRQRLWTWKGDLGPCHPVGEPLPRHHRITERS